MRCDLAHKPKCCGDERRVVILYESVGLQSEVTLVANVRESSAHAVPIYFAKTGQSVSILYEIDVVNMKGADTAAKLTDNVRWVSAAERNMTDIYADGEAPGADEDRIGRAFVGRCGQLLDKMLSSIGLNRDNCYICNVLPWRPPGNRTPSDSEIAVCLPFLKKQIEIVDPDIIFALGAVAVNTLLDYAESISKLRGKWLEYKTSKGKIVHVMAGYHPAYLLRTPAQKAKAWSDFLRLKKKLEEN